MPRPRHRILDGSIGYLRVPDCMGIGSEAVLRGMPAVRATRGLVLDLRDCGGGTPGTLLILAADLLPAARPRQVVGQLMQRRPEGWQVDSSDGAMAPEQGGLSAAGRRLVADAPRGTWTPAGRPIEVRSVLLCRPEVEPTLIPFNNPRFPRPEPYPGPVAVLYDQRCFSAAEITLAALRTLPNVTLVGTATTAAGGGSPRFHRLKNSNLEVMLTRNVFVRADGTLIDGVGVRPDVTVEADADTDTGGRDRMLEAAVAVLEAGIAGRRRGRPRPPASITGRSAGTGSRPAPGRQRGRRSG